MNVNTTLNYLTNSAQAAQRFAGDVLKGMQSNIERKPWGRYSSQYGSVGETARQAVQTGGQTAGASDVAAAAVLDVMTNETRKGVWRYTNMHRMVGDVGQYVAPRLGLDSPLAGAAAAAAVPIAVGALSGQFGSPLQGLRPAGYKAVAPVSKEEDPTGRKSQSPALEAGMRYLLGQNSQLLAYKDFKEERPDVMPSTYSEYQRFRSMKPEAGKLISVDPATQSFSALGGVIKGTARGLNDPELRLKGVPVTASAVLGTAAGLGAIKAGSQFLNPSTSFDPAIEKTGAAIKKVKRLLKTTEDPATIAGYTADLEKQTGLYEAAKQARREALPAIAQQFERLGPLKDPTLLAAGAITAGAVGLAAKKLFQKATEKRIQKEDPIEYLKYKHGSFQAAAEAVGKPQATSWQQLVS